MQINHSQLSSLMFEVCWNNWTLKAKSCKYAVKVIFVRIRVKEFGRLHVYVYLYILYIHYIHYIIYYILYIGVSTTVPKERPARKQAFVLGIRHRMFPAVPNKLTSTRAHMLECKPSHTFFPSLHTVSTNVFCLICSFIYLQPYATVPFFPATH